MTRTGVIGGAGFLGSHLVDALHQKGCSVRVLDAFIETPGRSVERRRHHLGRCPEVETLEGDLADAYVLDSFLEGLDRVYHFARVPGPAAWVVDPGGTRDRELAALESLLEGLERHGISQLIVRSDASVHGETTRQGASMTAPFAPMSGRAAWFVYQEALAEVWRSQGTRQLTILRPFEVYGPRMGSDALVHRFLVGALEGRTVSLPGDGGVVRDFVFAGDFIRAAVQARRARTDEASARFPIATGEPTSLLELVAAVRRVTGAVLKVDVGPASRHDPLVQVGDPSFTNDQLHVTCDTSLDAGLQLTWDWLQRRRG